MEGGNSISPNKRLLAKHMARVATDDKADQKIQAETSAKRAVAQMKDDKKAEKLSEQKASVAAKAEQKKIAEAWESYARVTSKAIRITLAAVGIATVLGVAVAFKIAHSIGQNKNDPNWKKKKQGEE